MNMEKARRHSGHLRGAVVEAANLLTVDVDERASAPVVRGRDIFAKNQGIDRWLYGNRR
jgi:hypothetical protein